MTNNVKIGFQNCNGLNDPTKRNIIISRFKQKYDIFCLLDTRLGESTQKEILQKDDWKIFFAGKRSNARGITIYINPKSDIIVTNNHPDQHGNYLIMELIIKGTPQIVTCVYGPTEDNPDFWNRLKDKVDDLAYLNVLYGGDTNLILNKELDCINYATETRPNATNTVNAWIENDMVFDVYRSLYPEEREYTWSPFKDPNVQRNHRTQMSRLDLVFASPHAFSYIKEMKHNYKFLNTLDHNGTEVELSYQDFKPGKGPFRTPPYLHTDPIYVNLINNMIRTTINDHLQDPYPQNTLETIPTETLANSPSNTTNTSLFEYILARAKEETAKFCKNQNIIRNREVEQLEKAVETWNSVTNADPQNAEYQTYLSNALLDLHMFLEARAEEKIMYLKQEWTLKGEKPSRWFLNMVKNKSAAKTVTKLENEGKLETDQVKIRNLIENFYSKLFKKRETKSTQTDIKSFLTNNNTEPMPEIPQVPPEIKAQLEEPLTMEELTKSLKKRKNSSAPGPCSFTGGWAKMFWPHLKDIFHKAVIEAKENERLSNTSLLGIITLLPKGDKDRTQIGNWRPITLLSIFYKIISGAYAERLKKVLPLIVHKSQKAYLSNRNIADVTKNIYDTMHYLEENEITSTLVLVDFSKAFDSISHDFIYNTMKLFGFGPDFIAAIKILLTKRESEVNVAGNSTKKFKLERGVPQGDPISAYLFILCIEILTTRLRNNPKIKKITLPNNEEICNECYADDLTIIIQRDPNSLREVINTLDKYAEISGLTTNIDKTCCANIGHNPAVGNLCDDLELKWITEFKLLGIMFYVDMKKMESNYEKPLQAIRKEIVAWRRRMHTPLGRIHVTKTILLSKLTHYPITLPNPKPSFMKELSDMISQFIWDTPIPKISTERGYNSHQQGGLKIVEIEEFWNLLKMSWFRKLIGNDDTWCILFNEFLRTQGIADATELLKKSDRDLNHIAEQSTNPFWKQALKTLAKVSTAYQKSHRKRALQASPFNNTTFAVQTKRLPIERRIINSADFPQLAPRITCLNDIYCPMNTILTRPEIEQKFNIRMNWLNAERLRLIIKACLNEIPQEFENKYNSLEHLIQKTKGTGMYRKLLESNRKKLKEYGIFKKWNEKHDNTIEDEYLQKAMKMPHYIPLETKFKYFQIKINNRILGVKHKTNIFTNENDICTFCAIYNRPQTQETIEHLFFNCPSTQEVLRDLAEWNPLTITGPTQNICDFLLIDQRENRDETTTINTFNILVKYYIWTCQKQNSAPTTNGCKNFIQFHSKIIANVKEKQGKFNPLHMFSQ